MIYKTVDLFVLQPSRLLTNLLPGLRYAIQCPP